MATPKRITKELAEANRKKLLILRLSGYNIKLDGSWGPWLEELYRKVVSKKGKNSSLANVGVMALPFSYGLAQLFEGLGSVTLPSIATPSAASLAMAAPVVLTLAGPAYGAYEFLTGKHHLQQVTPQERLVHTPDATRVSIPITPNFSELIKSSPIGERYINPVLLRLAVIGRHLAVSNDADSTGTTPVDTTRTSAPAPDPNSGNNRNDKKKRFKDIFWENSGTSSAPKHPNLWRNIRNWGVRVPVYTGIAAPVIDIVGNTVRASLEPLNYIHQWVWPATKARFSLERGALKLFGDAYANPADSAEKANPLVIMLSLEQANPVLLVGDTIIPVPRALRSHVTTKSELDSINDIWFTD